MPVIQASEIANNAAMSAVTHDLLRRMGMNVELMATYWGTVVQRRGNRDPGAWNISHTGWSGADNLEPAVNVQMRANGTGAWFGCPADPPIEAARDRWFAAGTREEQLAMAAEMQRHAFDSAPYVPLTIVRFPSGIRNEVQGVLPGPAPFLWNVQKG